MTLLGQYLNFRENDYDSQLHSLRLRDGLATSEQARGQILLGYENLLRRDPGRPDEWEIRKDIAALAMSVGEFAVARHHLETLSDDADFRDKHEDEIPELTYQWGQCYHAEDRIKEAYEKYVAALELEQYQYRYYLPLAVLFAQNQDLPHRDGSAEITTTLPKKSRRSYPEMMQFPAAIRLLARRIRQFSRRQNPKGKPQPNKS